MRKLFYVLAAISLTLFLISFVNLTRHKSDPDFYFSIRGVGFNVTTSDHKHDEVRDKLLSCIKLHKQQSDKYEHWYFILSFLVTVLTAASTLVSSIQAAKKSAAETTASTAVNKFAIIVAILTFLSTITNFSATQVNDKKSSAGKTMEIARQDLNDFNRKYDSAKSDEERNQANREYDEKICDQ